MTPFWLNVVDQTIQIATPVIVTAILGWGVKKAVQLFPALDSVLTATRVQQAEESVSNKVIAQSEDIAAGKTTLAQAVRASTDELSAAAKAAMGKLGTTDAQFAQRVTGNVMAKQGAAAIAAPVATPH